MPATSQFEMFGFLLGLLFGSFLNVCISRLPSHESIVKPGSHCMACGHAIRWYDNVPVLSWLLLRGRCRDCGTRISWQYPAVELAVGLWFIRPAMVVYGIWEQHVYWDFAPPNTGDEVTQILMIFAIAILGFFLIGLMVMDWQTQRLPDAFTVTGIVLGFALACVQAIFHRSDQSPVTLVVQRIASIATAALILLVIRWIYKALRKQEGMGLGDVKMLAMIAAFLGFAPTLVALFASVVVASLYGIAQLARRKAHTASRLPFGSFLAAGGLFSVLFGPAIVDWYAALLR